MTHSEILSTTQSELTVLTMWFLTLYGLLEDERLASAHQAEAFTHQIQHLQGTQLRSVQDELDRVQELKDSELLEAQAELSLVREEVQTLREAAEECAAERENDIATLQEELCRVRAEMSRVETNAQEYELEAVTLRAEIAMKINDGVIVCPGDVVLLREECSSLKAECETLKEANSRLTEKLQLLQDTRYKHTVSVLHLHQDTQRADMFAGHCGQNHVCMSFVASPSICVLILGFSSFSHSPPHLSISPPPQFSTEPPVLSLPFIGLIVIVAVLWCCWSELGS
uniref:KASH5-like coiled-coil domain-containing protein n=1 Tax=Pygocentrus nattereri TaxID=42514 RepID=A0A3B4CIP1_PYGNA